MPPDVTSFATFVEKGGVGKTTTAAHLAVAADRFHDRDVVVLDLAGTQNDIATHFGIDVTDDAIDAPVSAVFKDEWEFIRDNIDDVVDRMTFETVSGPDIIPADTGLGGADNNLANVPREERFDRLAAFIADDLARRYDVVALDLPGKEDNIAINGLYAVEDVVAPLRPGAFERSQLDALEADLAAIRESTPADPALAMVLPTMIDRRTNQSDKFCAEIEAAYPDICGPAIPSTANIGTLQEEGQTLFDVPDDELYASGREARDGYRAATDQLLTYIQP